MGELEVGFGFLAGLEYLVAAGCFAGFGQQFLDLRLSLGELQPDEERSRGGSDEVAERTQVIPCVRFENLDGGISGGLRAGHSLQRETACQTTITGGLGTLSGEDCAGKSCVRELRIVAGVRHGKCRPR